MARRSTKHVNVQSVQLQFSGGLNIADSPTAINDNQLTQAVNVWYNGGESVLSVRPGLRHVINPPTGTSILKLHWYAKTTTESYLVAAMDDGNLYFLDDANDEWVKIASLYTSAVVPFMITFNNRLIVADGGTNLHYWTGRRPVSSSTSLEIEATEKTIVLNESMPLSEGESISIYKSEYYYMVGTVTSYTDETKTLVIDVTDVQGSGTWDDWTVTVYVPITGSPQSTALAEIGGRLAANSASDLDAVLFSAVEDEENWDTNDGAAMFRAGYGDGLIVKGLAVFGSDMIVFKGGPAGKRIFRIATGGSSVDNWSISQLSSNLTAVSQHAIEFAGNNIFFGSETGVMDIAGVQQYGDLQTGVAGRMINTLFNGKEVQEMRLLPSIGVMFVLISGDYRVLAYHPHMGTWTTLNFGQRFMLTCCDAGGAIYIAGNNTALYRMAPLEDQDELEHGVYEDYTCLVRTKLFSFDAEVIIRKARLYSEAISDGTGEFGFTGRDALDSVTLLSWAPQSGAELLYDANGYLNEANNKLGAQTIDYQISRARARDQAIAFQIKTTSGRIKLRQATVELASVNG